MIEVLFGESEAGSMKAAKNTIFAGRTDGPTSIWMAGKKKEPEKPHAGWIQGTAEEVICLGFLLDIGNIQEAADSQYRKDLIYSLYAQEAWADDENLNSDLQNLGGSYCLEMERLNHYLNDGESIRIWYSHAPYSLCGFYHLCSLLQKYQADVHVVRQPEYKVWKDSIQLYQNWGNVAAEEFAAFLPCERKLSKQEIRMYAAFWQELKEDNSPLRAVINDRVTGVSEDFYDFLIWKNITQKPVKQARLIGDILGKNQLSVGDWWYAKRIQIFIEQGKIRIIEDSKNRYARMICLA